MAHFRGEGSVRCGWAFGGSRCGHNEIDGLEFCLQHVPDDILEEAEEITGMRRCRHRFGEPDACRQISVNVTEPPMCKNHGANSGSYQSKIGHQRKAEERSQARLGEVMTEHGMALLNAQPIENPLEELLKLAGEILALKDVLRGMVAKMDVASWRYTRSQAGEQLRAEITLYERSTERLAAILVQIAKLNIEGMLARIKAEQVAQIERALQVALQASGASIEGQDTARQVLLRELTASR